MTASGQRGEMCGVSESWSLVGEGKVGDGVAGVVVAKQCVVLPLPLCLAEPSFARSETTPGQVSGKLKSRGAGPAD